MAWLKNNPLVVSAAVVVVVLILAFPVFGIHTKFIDDEVNEAGPAFASGAAPSGLLSDEFSEEIAENMTADMAGKPVIVEVDEDMPEMQMESAAAGADAAEATAMIETIFTGNFVDRSHPTSGRADVLNDGSVQRFLRFEEFATDNGPDLNVYLSAAGADADAGAFDDDFIDLGDLKGNIGPQNYEIPADVDLERYSTVVIWCVRFGVAFGAADINAAG
ncbi:MAG: hypothetical protein ACI9BK_001646 [Acidimicrobiales bacterium]|jgi:hypothetical protein